MKTLPMIGLVLALTQVASSVQAQQVWRCGIDGRSFSDQPCKDGTGLEALRPRPAADVQAAAERGQREGALADALVQQRLQRDRQPTAARSSKAKATASPSKQDTLEPVGPRRKKLTRPAAADTFRATAPATRRSPG